MESLSTGFVACSIAGALLLYTASAAGHERWLEVEPFVANSAVSAKLYLVTGDALQKPELLPIRQKNRLLRFELRTVAGIRQLLPLLKEDQQPIATLPADMVPQSTSVLRLDTAPVDILLGAEKFQGYLFEEQLIDILMARAERREEDAPGKERYSRSMKALIQVGKKPNELATKPLGQELEIVPLVNPYTLSIGSEFAVQVLWQGRPLPNRAVSFTNRYHANIIKKTIRTDENGRVAWVLERPGQWLISLVHMERSREPEADWRSYWSTLTFELPPS